MKDFVLSVIDIKSMYYMLTISLKDNINAVHVPQFQLYYILRTTYSSNKNRLSCVVKYIICGGKIGSWNYRSGRIA